VTMQSLVFRCHSAAWKTGLASMSEMAMFRQTESNFLGKANYFQW
jgi:hypothetical protein